MNALRIISVGGFEGTEIADNQNVQYTLLELVAHVELEATTVA
jgi:hypothetical protein